MNIAGDATSFTDTGLNPSTTYNYAVYSYDGTGTFSAIGAKVTATTSVSDTPPPGVTGLALTPHTKSVGLAWTNPTAAGFTGVVIRRAAGTTAPASPTSGTAVTTTDTATKTFTDTGLDSGSDYSYAVFAQYGSTFADGVSATTTTLGTDSTPPAPVTGLTATPSAKVVELDWANPTDSDFADVVITRNGAPIYTTTYPTTRTYTDLGLTPGQSYTYTVTAQDSSGNDSTVASVSTTTTTATGPGPVVQASEQNVRADALPTTQINGVAWTQVIVGNTVYVGGSFSSARPAGAPAGTGETPRGNMLAYNLQTGVLIPGFAPIFNGPVRTLSVSPDGSKLYAGGDFTTVNGVVHNRIVAFTLNNGKVLGSFVGGTDATVKAIVATNSTVYIGGLFSAANGTARSRLAALNPLTGATTSWAPSANYTVNALLLTPDSSKIVVAGAFQFLDGFTAKGIGAVDATTGKHTTWLTSSGANLVYAYGPNAAFESLATDGTSIYASAYNFSGTGNLEGAVSFSPTDGAITWIEDCHGDTYSVFPDNGVLYTASHAHYCLNDGGWTQTNPIQYRHSLAFTTQVTGTLLKDTVGYPSHTGAPAPSLVNWFPDFTVGTYTGQNQAAWTVTGNSQYIVEGGEFPTVNNAPQQGLVRFAVRGVSPSAQKPRVSGDNLIPTLSLSGGVVHISSSADWDRDDSVLYYTVERRTIGQPNWGAVGTTVTQSAQWWNYGTSANRLSFTDNTVVSGKTYEYRMRVADADGNQMSVATETNDPHITIP